jgi:hypothetical protein
MSSHVLDLIKVGLADAEAAIRNHPPETMEVYESGVEAFQEGTGSTAEAPAAEALGLTFEDLRTVHRYLLAMAFIAAWYHLSRDLKRRDKAASSASLLVSGVGVDPDETFGRFLVYEQAWREILKANGIPNRPLRWFWKLFGWWRR